MEKKKLIVILLSLFFLGIIITGFVFRDKIASLLGLSGKMISPLSEEKVEKKIKEIKFEWVEWQDPAGFSFEYPKEVAIDDHPEDKINYAHLELTKKGKKGRIVILCNDSQYVDIDEWLKKDELVKNGNSLATEIASMSAKRVALGNEREIAGFIDWDEVIYTIDLQPEGEDYWRKVYNHLLSSFKLIPLEGESEEEFINWLEGFDTSGADIVEPVEIIE